MIDSISKLVIALLTMLMFAAVSAYCLLNGASEATQNTILTALIAWCAGVQGYFLGSSAGSSAKDKTITTLSNKP